jgi:hypothetical protein
MGITKKGGGSDIISTMYNYKCHRLRSRVVKTKVNKCPTCQARRQYKE